MNFTSINNEELLSINGGDLGGKLGLIGIIGDFLYGVGEGFVEAAKDDN